MVEGRERVVLAVCRKEGKKGGGRVVLVLAVCKKEGRNGGKGGKGSVSARY